MFKNMCRLDIMRKHVEAHLLTGCTEDCVCKMCKITHVVYLARLLSWNIGCYYQSKIVGGVDTNMKNLAHTHCDLQS